MLEAGTTEETIAPLKQKAIFIDGANVRFQFHNMGIRGNFRELRRILKNKIGSLPSDGQYPVLTVYPDPTNNGATRFIKLMRSFGYNLLESSTIDSADDEAIRERLGAIDPAVFGEIVLVTTDVMDFAEILEIKSGAGIKIYIVAADVVSNRSGYPMITANYADKFPYFTFINLNDFKDRLALEDDPRPRRSNEREQEDIDIFDNGAEFITGPTNSVGTKVVRANIKGLISNNLLTKFLESLGQLQEAYPDLYISFTTEPRRRQTQDD